MPVQSMEIAPSYRATAFTCPSCGVCAAQEWGKGCLSDEQGANHELLEGIEVTKCANCGSGLLWREGRVFRPPVPMGPPANPDLPEAALRAYNEARAVAALSPRSACALLRWVIDQIAEPLDPSKRNPDLSRRVARLGADRLLSPDIQQTLRHLRVIGGGATKPGSFDPHDDLATAEALLEVTCLFADHVVSTRKRMAEARKKTAGDQ